MNTLKITSASFLFVLAAAIPIFAQDTPAPGAPSIPSDSPKASSETSSPVVATSPVAAPTSAQPSAADMQKMMKEMMELNKPGENHKLLAGLVGSWTYGVKFWMNGDPNSKPQESKGTAVSKSIFDGRYFVMDLSGKMQMPGADGKMKDMTFKGMGIDGYDNIEKKFVSAWTDNMSTGIIISKGDYDPATKTFTYTTEAEMMPGTKTKVRETLKIVDKDHHTFEWYEDRGTGESKTMEIDYTRAKAK